MNGKRLALIEAVFVGRCGYDRELIPQAQTVAAAWSDFLETVEVLNTTGIGQPVQLVLAPFRTFDGKGIDFSLIQLPSPKAKVVVAGTMKHETGGALLGMNGVTSRAGDTFYGGQARYSVSSGTWDAAILEQAVGTTNDDGRAMLRTDLNGFLARVLKLVR